MKPIPSPIKSRATEPEAPALLMGSGVPPLPPLIDSVKRLINVECYAAAGQEASYGDRVRRLCSLRPLRRRPPEKQYSVIDCNMFPVKVALSKASAVSGDLMAFQGDLKGSAVKSASS